MGDDTPEAVQAMMDLAKKEVVLATLSANGGACSFLDIMDAAEQRHCDVASAALASLKRKGKVEFEGMMLLLPRDAAVVVRLSGAAAGGGATAATTAAAEYLVLRSCLLRAGLGKDTDRVGKAKKGTKIVVLERRLDSEGAIRVRCAQGWTTEQLPDGSRALELAAGTAPPVQQAASAGSSSTPQAAPPAAAPAPAPALPPAAPQQAAPQ
jgi:hypothetical protein